MDPYIDHKLITVSLTLLICSFPSLTFSVAVTVES